MQGSKDDDIYCSTTPDCTELIVLGLCCFLYIEKPSWNNLIIHRMIKPIGVGALQGYRLLVYAYMYMCLYADATNNAHTTCIRTQAHRHMFMLHTCIYDMLTHYIHTHIMSYVVICQLHAYVSTRVYNVCTHIHTRTHNTCTPARAHTYECARIDASTYSIT